MVQNRRDRLREATVAEIKTIARQQMAEQGTAALSLRAIATQMNMAGPSLYNYFKSRDDLLTALILEAFNSMADAIEGASHSRPPEDYAGRFFAMLMAYREWALTHPTDFILISGTPIPGYHAPIPATVEAAGRTMLAVIEVAHGAWQAGKLVIPPEYAVLPPEHYQQLKEWSDRLGQELSPPVLHLVLVNWSRLQGFMSLEIYGHLADILTDPAVFYRFEARAFLQHLGLNVPD
jgi:AcrR family transcriptional regulator